MGDLAKPGTTASGQDRQNVSCLAPELDGGHRRIQDPEGSNFTIKLVSNHLHQILRFTEIFNQETSQHSGMKFWWEHFIKPVDKNEFKDQLSRALNSQRYVSSKVHSLTRDNVGSPLLTKENYQNEVSLEAR